MIAKNHIDQLKHIRALLTHPAITEDDIFRRVRRVLAQIGYARYPYHHNLPKVIRASCQDDPAWFDDADDNRFVDIQKFSCPPDRFASLQRCNWAGDPVFYCSSENGVPIFEVRPRLGQTIVLSTWVDRRNKGPEIDFPIKVQGIIIGVEHLLASLPNSPIYKHLKESLLKDDMFNPKTPDAIKEVDAYIGDLFTEKYVVGSNLYWFTSAIAKLLMTDLDCLLYPSVESQITGYNLAIKKEIARNDLKVYGAAMYKIMEHDVTKSRYSLKPMKGLFAHPTLGKPIWRNIHPKHADARFTVDPFMPTVPVDEVEMLEYEEWVDGA